MLSINTQKNHTTLFWGFLAIWGLFFFFSQNPWLGGILALVWCIFLAPQYARLLFPQTSRPPAWLGAILLLSIVSLAGTAAYYIHYLPPILFFGLFFLISALPLFFKRCRETEGKIKKTNLPSIRVSVAVLLWIATLALSFFILWRAQTTEAWRTPWDTVPIIFFFVAGVVILLQLVLTFRAQEKNLTTITAIGTVGLFVSIACIVYPLGYGFDPFIHHATTAHLAEHGTIDPKPFYYIGQYSLVLFFNHVFHLPIAFLNAWLLPLLTMIFLPLAWRTTATSLMPNVIQNRTGLIGILLLPLSSFVATTPQGLANLWLLLLILASTQFLTNKKALAVLIIMALAAMAIHPLAGLPALIFWFLLITRGRLSLPISLIGSVSIPAAFGLLAVLSGDKGIKLKTIDWSSLVENLYLKLSPVHEYSPLLDSIYLYARLAWPLFILIALVAWWKNKRSDWWPFPIFGLILFINYLLLASIIDFPFLIEYERAAYSERLIPLIQYALAPLFIIGIGSIFSNLRTKPLILRAGAIIVVAFLAVSQLYLMYPRRDVYETSHGFNVSQADIDTVELIEKRTIGKKYIVLANQAVSAAAIKQIGFRYYNDQFFYPIPTGSQLYELFLEMNQQPTRIIAEEAKDIVATDITDVYYVVNSYWWQADRLKEQAKNSADDWLGLGNGAVYIFHYDFSSE